LFAVAAAVKLAPHVREVEIANAGLPYPFVLRSSQDRLDELSLPGFPLGLLPGAQFESRTILLDPGDVLLLGTDGIRSILNENGDPFESDHLERTLRMLVGQDGKTVIETLMATALKFGNGNALQDDVNLVAVTKLGTARDMCLVEHERDPMFGS
jgi:sigma-B regulation protein RsbU (phosphoserine phosphatase)